MAYISDAKRLRNRARRLLELATRSRCEGRSDYTELLIRLATEIFEHARELEERKEGGNFGASARNLDGSTQDDAA